MYIPTWLNNHGMYYIYIYIYIVRERVRDREREGEREGHEIHILKLSKCTHRKSHGHERTNTTMTPTWIHKPQNDINMNTLI